MAHYPCSGARETSSRGASRIAFHCVSFPQQLASPTNPRPAVWAQPLPGTLSTERPSPLQHSASWAREDIFKNIKLLELICDYFFPSCWKRAGQKKKKDSMMLSPPPAFPNRYTCCALSFLSEEHSRHRPKYELFASCISG